MFKHPTIGPVKVNYKILALVVLGIALMICWICSALNWNVGCVSIAIYWVGTCPMFKHPTVGLGKVDCRILACVVVLGMVLVIC